MEKKGLTTKQAESIMKSYGMNEIPEKKNYFLKKLIKQIFSPISLMLLSAAILSRVIDKVFDFYFILGLMIFNIAIEFWQEYKADKSIQKLSERLSFKVRVLRDGEWKMIESREIVPGDIIELFVGDILPADLKVIEAKNLSINESVLTGESLPKNKKQGDIGYSGSHIVTGYLMGEVSATGKNTSFGKTIKSIEKSTKKSLLEKDILSISKFLIIIAIACVFILSIFFLINHKSIGDLLILDLSLLIAGVPVALPVVMSLIISLGVLELSKKDAIVRRLSSLEDLSNVQILLSDKTGTLTKNEISIEKIKAYSKYSEEEIISFASACASKDQKNTINQSIMDKLAQLKLNVPKLIDFTPADSERKRASSIIELDNEPFSIAVGSPAVIKDLCRMTIKESSTFDKDLKEATDKGYKILAVSIVRGKKEKSMSLAGLLYLTDSLLPESEGVIKFLKEQGIETKILTGDNVLISNRISKQLGLSGIVVNRRNLNLENLSSEQFKKISTFAEILPEDKYQLVLDAKKEGIVAVTGDGVNDLAAIKESHVGIAVSNSVDALKSSADIVLLTPGLEVIKNAIVESRKIFSRLYSYSIYRLSESFRLIISILILGIIAGDFPLTPIQLILLAFLNDLPIISLAFNRVKISNKPSRINPKKRFTLSTIFGTMGIFNSVFLYLGAVYLFHLNIAEVQTMFFLKLAVSGHLLILVAHTKERWWKYLPSKVVLIAILITQTLATTLALTGALMSSKISLLLVGIVWGWSIIWMQFTELAKYVYNKKNHPTNANINED